MVVGVVILQLLELLEGVIDRGVRLDDLHDAAMVDRHNLVDPRHRLYGDGKGDLQMSRAESSAQLHKFGVPY